MQIKTWRFTHVLSLISFVSISGLSFGNEDNQAELSSVQTEISKQENKLNAQKIEQDKLNALLKTQTKEITTLNQTLKTFKDKLSAIEREVQTTEKQIAQINQTIVEQKALLVKQIETAFMQGQSSTMEMLFSSEDTQRNDRVVGYIGYLNREREKTIETIKVQEAEVIEKQNEIKAQRVKQEALVKEQNAQLKALETVKAEQTKTLAQLKKQMGKTERGLIALRDDEINLQYKIKQAQREAQRNAEKNAQKNAEKIAKSDKPLDNTTEAPKTTGKMLSNQSGKSLGKPIEGAIITNYGDQLGGELVSKGWVLSGAYGQSVKAVQSGRVLIADYLQGYGNVIVLDHGSGYMSLYGYNSEVLVSQGDEIQKGAVISKVGQREGEQESGLYFEIRKEGEAINPTSYLNK